jgi:TonB family protein
LGNRPEAAIALIHRGSIALIGKNKSAQAAIEDFARAQTLNSGDAGESDMWMAIAQDRQGNTAQADSSFQSALRKGDPNSANTATVLDLYAEFLRQQRRMSEARSIRDQSAAIRRALGGKALSVVQNDEEAVYKIGGEISAPVLLSKVEPDYSQDARAAKYQGSVLLYAEVGVDGSAHNIRVSRGLGLGLNEKAIQAIRRKFKPAGKAGQPVRVGVSIEVNFRLL